MARRATSNERRRKCSSSSEVVISGPWGSLASSFETKLTRNLLHSSRDGFMQPHHLLLEEGRKGLNWDNSMSEGPKLNEIGPFISRKVFPSGRAEEVRVKLTDNQ